MQAPTTRIFRPARIVALALIAALVLTLGWLRFAPDSGPVSVPAGAHAGQLILKPCHYGTERGSYDADCGTLVVPENRARSTLAADRAAGDPHPRARRRIRPSRSSGSRAGPASATCTSRTRAASPATATSCSSAIAASTARPCSTAREVVSALKHSADLLGEKSCARRRTATGRARATCAPTASTSPATRCPSASTTSRQPGARSATSASI